MRTQNYVLFIFVLINLIFISVGAVKKEPKKELEKEDESATDKNRQGQSHSATLPNSFFAEYRPMNRSSLQEQINVEMKRHTAAISAIIERHVS